MTDNIKVLFIFNKEESFGIEITKSEAIVIISAWINGDKDVEVDSYKVGLFDAKEIRFFQ